MKDLLKPLRLLAVLATLVFAVGVAACGSDDNDSSGGGGGGGSVKEAGGTTPDETKCGDGTGEKATGTPIKAGSITTKIPGIDFTDGSDAAAAYFKCVNDNGGIKGHPVDFIVEEHGSDPQQVGSFATQARGERQGRRVRGGLLDPRLPGQPRLLREERLLPDRGRRAERVLQHAEHRRAEHGPGLLEPRRRALRDRQGPGEGRDGRVSPKQPGNEAVNQIALSYAKEKGLKAISRLETVPLADPASLVQAIVAQAGDGGGVVLDFTPPEGVKILQAAAQQGVIDKVKWGSSTPLNDTSVPDAIGKEWEGKIAINAELALLDSDGPDMQLYRAVNKKYSPDNPLGSFGQMGFVAAKMFTDTLLKLPEDQLNKEGINKAVLGIKNYKTDVLCKPWYFQEMKLHVPNNTDLTVTPKDGKMAQHEGCTDIPDSYPDLKYVREFEAQNDVNKG